MRNDAVYLYDEPSMVSRPLTRILGSVALVILYNRQI